MIFIFLIRVVTHLVDSFRGGCTPQPRSYTCRSYFYTPGFPRGNGRCSLNLETEHGMNVHWMISYKTCVVVSKVSKRVFPYYIWILIIYCGCTPQPRSYTCRSYFYTPGFPRGNGRCSLNLYTQLYISQYFSFIMAILFYWWSIPGKPSTYRKSDKLYQ
jgi:hypothetical protein